MQIAQPRSEIGSQRTPVEDPCSVLRGKGQYVEDVCLAGPAEVVFLRSPYAHARMTGLPDNGQAGS